MRCAFAILKYIPAVLCGLLVVFWAISLYCVFGVRAPLASGDGIRIGGHAGSVVMAIWTRKDTDTFEFDVQYENYLVPLLRRCTGGTEFYRSATQIVVLVPIPFLLTLSLPLAIAPFNRFRFPLWSYFAYTGLVALELAYYLRA